MGPMLPPLRKGLQNTWDQEKGSKSPLCTDLFTLRLGLAILTSYQTEQRNIARPGLVG